MRQYVVMFDAPDAPIFEVLRFTDELESAICDDPFSNGRFYDSTQRKNL